MTTSTSIEALKSTDTAKIRGEILGYFKTVGPMTSDECEHFSQRTHQCVSARIFELRELGELADSGKRRKTRSNKTAIVWQIVNGQRSLFANPRRTKTDLREDCIHAAILAKSSGDWSQFDEAIAQLRKAESK